MGHPSKADAGPFITLIPAFLEDILKGPHIGSRLDKEMRCLIQRLFCLVRGISRTHDIQRHGMSDKMVAFPPDMNSEFNIYILLHSSAGQDASTMME
jgi:hypothetical protein